MGRILKKDMQWDWENSNSVMQKGVELHFDIAQINTIMWEDEKDIPLRLKNRIEATIK